MNSFYIFRPASIYPGGVLYLFCSSLYRQVRILAKPTHDTHPSSFHLTYLRRKMSSL